MPARQQGTREEHGTAIAMRDGTRAPRGAGEEMRDRTAEQVRTQLDAMGCERYELGVRDGRIGRMVTTTVDPAAVMRRLSWLKHRNANGHDIYVRPLGSVGLVLLDDLTPAMLEELHGAELDPTAVVETSPGNLQVWIRLAAVPIAPELATAAASKLAALYGGDLAGANWRQFGRLSGFTNRKPQHRQGNGRYPFVLFRLGRRGVAPAAADLLAKLAVETDTAAISNGIDPHFSPGRAGPVCVLAEQYRQAVAEHCRHYSVNDWSRLDWMVTREIAAGHPDATVADLAAAITRGSPHVEDRKVGHVADYAERTARKAIRSLGRRPT